MCGDLPLNLGLPPVGGQTLLARPPEPQRKKDEAENWEGMVEKNDVPKCSVAVNPLPLCKCLTSCKDLTEVCSIIPLTRPCVSTLQVK